MNGKCPVCGINYTCDGNNSKFPFPCKGTCLCSLCYLKKMIKQNRIEEVLKYIEYQKLCNEKSDNISEYNKLAIAFYI